MKKGPLTIYIDRLKDDDTETIFEEIPVSFFQLDEKELTFIDKITISGQAYLAKNHLILNCKIKALAEMPCCICNEKTRIPILINDFSQTVEICEVPSAIYDYCDEIRSAILLKIPHFVECQGGKCPTRTEISPFLKTDDTHTPFKDLSL